MAPCLHEIPHACQARCIAMRAMTEAKRRSRSRSTKERPFTGRGRQSEQWPKDLSEAIPAFPPSTSERGGTTIQRSSLYCFSFLASSSDPNKADNKRVRDGAGSGIPAMPCRHARGSLSLLRLDSNSEKGPHSTSGQ